MKKLVLAAAAILPFTALAQDGTYDVKGKVGSFNAPAKMYLEYQQKDKTITDSITLVNGSFEFKGAVGAPINAYLVLNEKGNGAKGNDYKSIYLENGTINVNSDNKLAEAKVDGPKANQDNAKYQALIAPIDAEENAYSEKERAETAEQKNSEAYQREITAAEKVVDNKEIEANKKFAKENPDSYISLTALETLTEFGVDYSELAPLYDGLTANVKQSDAGKDLGDRLPKLKAIALGETAPLFTEADTAGKMVSLESFRGKYVLVDFWASWCGPCRRENPHVVAAYNKYKTKNFTILGVSLDRSTGKQKWLDAIHKDKLTWTQVSDLQYWKSKEADLYVVRGIPMNFLLDPNGKIIAKSLHGFDLEDKLAELFGKVDSAPGTGGSK